MVFLKRLFRTLGLLISRPGFLSIEYKKGNRAEFTHPLWLLFGIALAFFIIFYFGFRNKHIDPGDGKGGGIVKTSVIAMLKESYRNAKTQEDSLKIQQSIRILEDEIVKEKATQEPFIIFESTDTIYKSVSVYDSIQRLLPPEKKDSWFARKIKILEISIWKRYSGNTAEFFRDIADKFIHFSPYIFFILLPLYALFLKLLYSGKRGYAFRDHSIFLIHIYGLLFLLMLVYLGILALKDYTTISRLVLSAILIFVFGFIYTVRAMKKFYEQSWTKSILKFFLFNLFCIISLLLVFTFCFWVSLN